MGIFNMSVVLKLKFLHLISYPHGCESPVDMLQEADIGDLLEANFSTHLKNQCRAQDVRRKYTQLTGGHTEGPFVCQ